MGDHPGSSPGARTTKIGANFAPIFCDVGTHRVEPNEHSECGSANASNQLSKISYSHFAFVFCQRQKPPSARYP